MTITDLLVRTYGKEGVEIGKIDYLPALAAVRSATRVSWIGSALRGEPFLQVGLDRRSGQMRVDVGIAFLAQGLSDLFDAGAGRRQLKRAFDDVLSLHDDPDGYVLVMNG
jgi:hypothetical protein